MVLQRLHYEVAQVCPIDGVAVPDIGNSATVRVDYAASATPAQIAAADAVVAGFDWSSAADATFAARRAKADAATLYDRAQTAGADITDRVIIAFAQLVLDRFNLHAQKFTDLQAAVAAATSLANFQTRAATVGNIAQITQQQLVDAIKAKIAATGE